MPLPIPDDVIRSNPLIPQMLAQRALQTGQGTPQGQQDPLPNAPPAAAPAMPQPDMHVQHTHVLGQTPPQAMPKPLTPIQPSANEQAQRAQLTKLQTTGSGISQIKNPVGRGLLTALDAVGSGLFPRIAMNIPGTEAHHQALTMGTQGALQGEEQQRGREEAQRLETAKAEHQIATETAAAKNPNTEFQLWQRQNPQGTVEDWMKLQAENRPDKGITNEFEKWMRDNPNGKLEDWEAFKQAHQQAVKIATPFEKWMKDNPNADVSDWMKLQSENRPERSDAETQFVDEYRKAHPTSTIAEAQRAFAKNKQLPPQVDRGQNFIDPATQKLVRVEPGGAVPKGALTAAGENTLNTPTAQTKTMAETAPKVLDLANRVGQLVDQQEKTLGPAASRWNEFMAGKVGAPNPDFTRLRTDVGLLQTALMRMHVGSRGGEQMMEHFRTLIDTSKQSPENLRAALDEIKAYANTVAGTAVGQPSGNVIEYERNAQGKLVPKAK